MGRLGVLGSIAILSALVMPTVAFAPSGAPHFAAASHGALAMPELGAAAPAGIFVTPVGGANEPMILIDNQPTHYIWIGALTSLWRSADNGATWRTLAPPTVPGGFTDGYALAQDPAGTLYVSDTQGQDIWVAASHDAGITWQTTTVSRFAVEPDAVADRPWLATNGNGNVALVDNSLTQGEQCDYSTDGGATFTTRATLKADQGPTNAGNIVFDHAGHVTYALDAGVQSWRGATPCASTSVAAGAPSQLALPADGPQIFTQLALDASDRPYVAQPTPSSAAMELRAFPGWTTSGYKAIAVSPAIVKSNTFGAIAARSNGEIAVAWYGSTTAGDPTTISSAATWNLYVVRVQNFWSATPTLTTTTVATDMHDGPMCFSGVTCTASRNLGDYFGIAYDASGNLHIAFVDDHNNGGTVKYAQLAAI